MSAMLDAVLDTLLPGGEGFPPAGGIGLAAWLAARPEFAAPLQAVLALCPADFAAHGLDTRITLLRAVEQAAPAAFGRVQVGAYSGYYTHPEVLAVIRRDTGYLARPPQPDGYVLPPFDTALLARVAARAPHFRETDDVSA